MLRQRKAHRFVTERSFGAVLQSRIGDGTPVAAPVRMKTAIALIAVALLGALVGSMWIRRGELEVNGESGTMLLGLAVCFVCVVVILVAVAGKLWP